VSTAAAPRSPLERANPYLLLTLTVFFWAINWVLARALATHIPAFALSFFRWLIALLILAPFALPRLARDWPAIRRSWKMVAVLGAIGMAAQNTLVYAGLHYTTATNGILLNPSIPVLIVAMSWLFLREPISAVQIAGVAVSMLGVLAIVSHGSFETLAAFRFNGGDILVLLSMVAWATYTVALRWAPRGVDPLTLLFALAGAGVLWLAPLFAWEFASGERMALTLPNLAALGFVALFPSVLGYVFWNHGVERVGASVAGLFVYLLPVFGVALAWLFLGERLYLYHIAGIALILTGIWIASRHSRAPKVPAALD
jgi:drug/metabolite transporter (DMT)-like permease